MSEPLPEIQVPPGSWATPDEIRRRWASAPMDDELLVQMMTAAQSQLENYVANRLARYVDTDGQLVIPEDVLARWREALALQVRANGQALDRDGDVLGFGDGFGIRVRPLGGDVKALMRPKRGMPVIR